MTHQTVSLGKYWKLLPTTLNHFSDNFVNKCTLEMFSSLLFKLKLIALKNKSWIQQKLGNCFKIRKRSVEDNIIVESKVCVPSMPAIA